MGTSCVKPPDCATELGILELGTNSLKLHLVVPGEARPQALRTEWDLGLEVYSSGALSRASIDNALVLVRGLLRERAADPFRQLIFGIATGAFRDAENSAALMARLHDDLGVPVRILTTDQEALLLSEGSSRAVTERPGIAFDLGGGSLEIVYLGNGMTLRETVPVGAIKLYHVASLCGGSWDEQQARQLLDQLLVKALPFRVPTVHGTGGTVKAIAEVYGSEQIPYAEIVRMEEQGRLHGAPRALTPRRREIFLPGLLVVRRLLAHVGATALCLMRLDLGEILIDRLRPFEEALRGPLARDFFLEDPDIFRA